MRNACSIGITLASARETRRRKRAGLDPIGQLAAIIAIASFTFALVEGGTMGWDSLPIIAAFCIALVGAISFLLVESRGRSPMLPLGLFREPTLSAAMVAGLAINFALSGLLFLLTLYFQQARGYSPSTTGLAFLPLTIAFSANPVLTGRLVGRIGPKIPTVTGFGLTAVGTLTQLWTNAHTPYYAITLIGLLFTGFGVSFTIPSLVAAVVSSAPREQAGVASGALNSVRQLGTVLGVSILGTIANSGRTFIAGMHASLILVGIVLLAGAGASTVYIGRTSIDKIPRD